MGASCSTILAKRGRIVKVRFAVFAPVRIRRLNGSSSLSMNVLALVSMHKRLALLSGLLVLTGLGGWFVVSSDEDWLAEGRATVFPSPYQIPTEGVPVVIDRSKLDQSSEEQIRELEEVFGEVPGQRLRVFNLQAQFQGLLSSMRAGNLAAARALANALYRCSGYHDLPFSPETYQAYMDEIDNPEGDHQELTDLQKERLRQAKRFEYGICGNVTAEQRKVRREALEMLSESGDPEARLAFAALPTPLQEEHANIEYLRIKDDFVRKADRYLELEQAKGNVAAFDVAAALNGYDLAGNPMRNCCNHARNIAYQMAAVQVLKRTLSQVVRGSSEFNALIEQIAAREIVIENQRRNLAQVELQKLEEEYLKEIMSRCCGP